MIKNLTGKGHGILQPLTFISEKLLQRLTIFDYLGSLSISRRKLYLIVATCNATKNGFREGDYKR
jgi:hypothetical protein